MSSATDIHDAWTLVASSIAGDAQMVLGKAANAMEFWQLMRDSEALLGGAKAVPPQFAVRFCRAGAPTSRQDPRLAGGVELVIVLDSPCTAVWETTCMLLVGESLVAADKLVGASLEHTVLAATNAFRICLWFSATLTAAEQDAVAYRWRSKLGVKMPTDPTGVFSARLGAGPDQSPRPFEFAFQGPSGAAVIPSAEPAKSDRLIDIPQLRKLQDIRLLNAMPPNVWESYFDWNLLSKNSQSALPPGEGLASLQAANAVWSSVATDSKPASDSLFDEFSPSSERRSSPFASPPAGLPVKLPDLSSLHLNAAIRSPPPAASASLNGHPAFETSPLGSPAPAGAVTLQDVQGMLEPYLKFYTIELLESCPSDVLQDLAAEGCPKCLQTTNFGGSAGAGGSPCVVLRCKQIECQHIVHIDCLLNTGAHMPTLHRSHCTNFFRSISVSDINETDPTSAHDLVGTRRCALELEISHLISNAQILRIEWPYSMNSAVDSRSGKEYMFCSLDPELHKVFFSIQRARAIFKCTDVNTGECVQHDANYSVFGVSALYIKLVLVDSTSRNVLVIGVRRRDLMSSFYISYVKYEFASSAASGAIPPAIANGNGFGLSMPPPVALSSVPEPPSTLHASVAPFVPGAAKQQPQHFPYQQHPQQSSYGSDASASPWQQANQQPQGSFGYPHQSDQHARGGHMPPPQQHQRQYQQQQQYSSAPSYASPQWGAGAQDAGAYKPHGSGYGAGYEAQAAYVAGAPGRGDAESYRGGGGGGGGMSGGRPSEYGIPPSYSRGAPSGPSSSYRPQRGDFGASASYAPAASSSFGGQQQSPPDSDDEFYENAAPRHIGTQPQHQHQHHSSQHSSGFDLQRRHVQTPPDSPRSFDEFRRSEYNDLNPANMSGPIVTGIPEIDLAFGSDSPSVIDHVRGRVYMLSKSQGGSRFVQQKLDEGDSAYLQLFFDELNPFVSELMMDSFAHYAIEKLIRNCSAAQRLDLLHVLASGASGADLVTVACHKQGSFSLQSTMDALQTESEIDVLAHAMEADMVRLATNASGHFVLLRFLQHFPQPQHTTAILESIQRNCLEIATDHHGLRVIKSLVDALPPSDLHEVYKAVARLTMKLAENQYGNYCVQHVLDHAPPNVCANIKMKMEGKYVRLAKQKFSSNVVEKCLRTSNLEWRTVIIRELIASVGEMIRDRYANYVLQTAVALADPQQVMEFTRAVGPHMQQLRENVRTKWTKIIKSAQQRAQLSGAPMLGGMPPMGGPAPMGMMPPQQSVQQLHQHPQQLPHSNQQHQQHQQHHHLVGSGPMGMQGGYGRR